MQHANAVMCTVAFDPYRLHEIYDQGTVNFLDDTLRRPSSRNGYRTHEKKEKQNETRRKNEKKKVKETGMRKLKQSGEE